MSICVHLALLPKVLQLHDMHHAKGDTVKPFMIDKAGSAYEVARPEGKV